MRKAKDYDEPFKFLTPNTQTSHGSYRQWQSSSTGTGQPSPPLSPSGIVLSPLFILLLHLKPLPFLLLILPAGIFWINLLFNRIMPKGDPISAPVDILINIP